MILGEAPFRQLSSIRTLFGGQLMPRVVLFVTTLCLLALANAPPAHADEGPFKGLDDYIDQAIKEWEVPGLALAVVKDDRVVLSKGYGVRKLGETNPVDADTVFAIGSISKSFTAAALGLLVDEGKIKWNDPVSKHMPSFQLHDPYVSKEMTIRDLLSHRSGLNRHELLWYGSSLSRAQILERLRLIKPDWSFRSQFGYQNMMYLAAGELIPAVTRKSWDEFIEERFFKPLGMIESNTSITLLRRSRNVATPHHKVEDKVERIRWRNIDNIGGAGSINSNVLDMAQWVRLHLNDGKWDKKQLLSSAVVNEMRTPQTVIRLEGPTAKLNPHSHLAAYGLGWMIQDYRDRKLVHHGGGIDGMTAQLAFIPEEKLGLVILSNRSGSLLPTALTYRIFDAFLKAPQRDWSAEYLKLIKGAEELAKKARKKQEAERVKDTKPSLSLDKYAGTYKSDIYGEIKVTLEKSKEKGTEKLKGQFGPSFVAELEHWNYDTFRTIPRDRTQGKQLVTFTLDAKGKVSHLRQGDDPNTDLVFKRVEDAKDKTPVILLSEDELKKFVGKYELKNPPVEVSIELVGGKLKAIVPGAPPLVLAPIKPTRFKLEDGPPGFIAEFHLAEGKVKSVTLTQPSQPELTFERKG
jgi:CubicO group peptidase (beta-lactamase class C family)